MFEETKICLHCRMRAFKGETVCTFCGAELTDVTHTIEEEIQLRKELKDYLRNVLGLYKRSSKFYKNLDKYNFHGEAENEHVSELLFIEYYNNKITLEEAEKRYYELVQDYKTIENLSDDDFKQKILDEASKIFNNILLDEPITFTDVEYFEGEKVPETHIKNKHGTGSRVLATGLFGNLGLAATNGIKEETTYNSTPRSSKIKSQIELFLENDGLKIKSTNSGNNQLKQGFLLNWNQIVQFKGKDLILVDGSIIPLNHLSTIYFIDVIKGIYIVERNSVNFENEHPFYNKIDEWELDMDITDVCYDILEKTINDKAIGKLNQSNTNLKANAVEIERYYDLKEKGIISEEDFEFKKNQLLGLHEDSIRISETDDKFCLNCGNKMKSHANFCTNCGEKL